MARWSKAPRGLFVLPRVARIFTGTSVSPGPLPRQRPTRYSIRAGRNLPDKEFRYLRTIIVIAAVHQGFGSPLLKGLPLTGWHRAGVSPHTSPCGLAETCVFGKQSVGPFPCARRGAPRARRFTPSGAPSPEVTGPDCLVPWQRVSRSPRHAHASPPVSVCGTGAPGLPRGFSRRCGVARVGLARGRGLPIPPHPWARGICLARRATGLDVCCQQNARASPPGPPVGDDGAPWYGTVNPLSIAYAPLGLGLGPTDPERIDLAQEPLGFRCGRFSRPLRYSCRHSHFRPLQPPSRVGLRRRTERSPTARPPVTGARAPGFGAALSPVTLSAPDHSTSELLRTLSRVAASEPTSWLSGPSDRLSH
jgi:hypothetical protein